MRKLAVIGLNTLESIGIKSILGEICQLSVEISPSMERRAEYYDHADRYIISAEIFAKHSEFFLPRKNKTLIICNGKSFDSGNMESVGKDTDMIELYSILEQFVKEKRGEECSSELSSREIEVLKELVNGLTIKEIADKLCISASTAVSHRKNISTKLGIRSISGLSVYAIMNGII